MTNIKFLLSVALIFGVVAIALWSTINIYNVEIVYPICCNIVQFVAIAFLYKEL